MDPHKWWPMGFHNRNRLRRSAVKSDDSNWINSPNSQFWDISRHILLTLLGSISTCVNGDR